VEKIGNISFPVKNGVDLIISVPFLRKNRMKIIGRI